RFRGRRGWRRRARSRSPPPAAPGLRSSPGRPPLAAARSCLWRRPRGRGRSPAACRLVRRPRAALASGLQRRRCSRSRPPPALAVELARDRLRVKGPAQSPLLRAEEWVLELPAQALPDFRRIDRQNVVLADRDVAAFRELLAETGGNRQPPFLVHPDPVCARE